MRTFFIILLISIGSTVLVAARQDDASNTLFEGCQGVCGAAPVLADDGEICTCGVIR